MTTGTNGRRGDPGPGLGDSIIGRFVRAATDVRARAGPINQRVAENAFTRVTNHISDEVRSVMGPLFREAAEHPDTPDEARPLLRALGNRRGQAWAWIGGTATGAALGGGLMNLLSNYMNPVVLPLIAARPAGVLSPSDAAAGEARSVAYSRDWAREAAYSGIDGERFNALVALNRQSLSPDQILTLMNRGDMPVSTATALLRSQGYRPDVIDDMLSLRRVDVSPEIAAAMWNRNIVSTDEGRRIAARSGLSTQDFDRLIQLGGEPPSVEELMLAWQRGTIDESDVDRALIQGPLRKEWIPVVKERRWNPLPPTEAADSVNQGHMPLDAATREARFSGVRPEHFQLMVENAGLPPGLEFASEAYNRGLLSDAGWTAMFLESRIKNRYIPLMKAMRERIIPQETIRLLWRNGVYSDTEAVDGLKGHGFSQRDAEALLQLERERKSEGTKELTRAQLVDLYEEYVIDATQLQEGLSAQGYDAQEVELQVAIADINRTRRYINAATTRVKSAYLKGVIDEAEANGRLTELGYGPTQKSELIALWDLEREVSPPQLTIAQILSAAKKQIIGWDDAERRLLDRGYDPVDAAILLADAGKPRTPTQGGT